MAAYAASVTLDIPEARHLAPGVKAVWGKCAISNYNQTGAEITGITGLFVTTPRVVAEGLSSNGYLVRWDETDKAFHAYYPTVPQALVASATVTAAVGFDGSGDEASAGAQTAFGANAAGAEVANDVNVGTVSFVAIGFA